MAMTTTVEIVLMALPPTLLLAFLGFTVMNDSFIQKEKRRIVLLIIVVCLTLIGQNVLESQLAIGEPKMPWRTLASIYGYAIRPVILILFLYIIQPEKKHWLWWVLAGVNAAVYGTALFSRAAFWIDHHNIYRAGPLASICLVISVFLLVYLLVQTIKKKSGNEKREKWIPILTFMVILLAIIADYIFGYDRQPITFLSISIVISVMFYYIWLHRQFVRDHEQALVADQRMSIMLSQIQPHFLYNTLSVIQSLCRSDPAQAEAATIHFSRYLRGNMDSLLSESMIPFSQELKHTQEYLELEKMRFQDRLAVRYDIQCTMFELPPLTLQPIVENAVRHGIRGNPDGSGTVAIAARELPNAYEITVTDNGVGFDPNQVPENAEHSHIGIQNVSERLLRICDGTLTYHRPSDGKGTVAMITLPRR